LLVDVILRIGGSGVNALVSDADGTIGAPADPQCELSSCPNPSTSRTAPAWPPTNRAQLSWRSPRMDSDEMSESLLGSDRVDSQRGIWTAGRQAYRRHPHDPRLPALTSRAGAKAAGLTRTGRSSVAASGA